MTNVYSMLDKSSFYCDLDTMFSKADENGSFNVRGASIDMLVSLELGLDEGYCDCTSMYDCRITESGKKWWAEYKSEMQRLENLALHSVD